MRNSGAVPSAPDNPQLSHDWRVDFERIRAEVVAERDRLWEAEGVPGLTEEQIDHETFRIMRGEARPAG
jgi:hypothetical protein